MLLLASPAVAEEAWIVFGSFRGGDFTSSIHAIRPDGTGERELSPHLAGYPASLDPWTMPDAELIAFSRGGSNHKTSVWLLDPASGDEEQVTGLVMTRFKSGRAWPSMRPGTYVLTFVREGKNERRIAMQEWPGKTQVDLGPGEYPSWSPDGDRLAYEREGSIWIHDFNTGLVAPVETDLAATSFPSWAPDGENLLVVGADGPAVDLFEISPSGEVIRRLTNTPDIDESAPAWSPDGRFIAFAADATEPKDGWQKSIFVLDVAAAESREVTTGEFNDTRPTWTEKLPE
jgi:Tol biopolymer transport system component